VPENRQMRDYNHFLFYSEQITEHHLLLDHSETHHAVNVLRLKAGDQFKATDGKGNIFTCVAESITNNILTGIIKKKKLFYRSICSIHIIIGITGKESFEKIVLDCTALGINRITPAITEHSQKNWWQNSWKKQRCRFHTKMITAIKQSLFPFIPVLDSPINLDHIVLNETQTVFVADPNGSPLQLIPKEQKHDNITCIIGPPGGFSENEIDIFKEKQFKLIKIGPNRLRTELATVVLCAQIIGKYLNY